MAERLRPVEILECVSLVVVEHAVLGADDLEGLAGELRALRDEGIDELSVLVEAPLHDVVKAVH